MTRDRFGGSLTVALLLISASPSHADDDASCRAISLKGDLVAGQAYERAIGENLTLHLLPRQFADPSVATTLDGWGIELWPTEDTVAGHSAHDFIYPINPPLRFNPWQDLGTSYGITAADKLQRPIEYAFVLNKADYRTISNLVTDVLWFRTGADPHADEKYLTALKTMPLGKIRFSASHVTTSENGRSVRSLTFVARVIAPNIFTFSTDLVPVPAACPDLHNWP